MKPNKKEAYKKIAQLIERFSEHVEEYKRDGYNVETENEKTNGRTRKTYHAKKAKKNDEK